MISTVFYFIIMPLIIFIIAMVRYKKIIFIFPIFLVLIFWLLGLYFSKATIEIGPLEYNNQSVVFKFPERKNDPIEKIEIVVRTYNEAGLYQNNEYIENIKLWKVKRSVQKNDHPRQDEYLKKIEKYETAAKIEYALRKINFLPIIVIGYIFLVSTLFSRSLVLVMVWWWWSFCLVISEFGLMGYRYDFNHIDMINDSAFTSYFGLFNFTPDAYVFKLWFVVLFNFIIPLIVIGIIVKRFSKWGRFLTKTVFRSLNFLTKYLNNERKPVEKEILTVSSV